MKEVNSICVNLPFSVLTGERKAFDLCVDFFCFAWKKCQEAHGNREVGLQGALTVVNNLLALKYAVIMLGGNINVSQYGQIMAGRKN